MGNGLISLVAGVAELGDVECGANMNRGKAVDRGSLHAVGSDKRVKSINTEYRRLDAIAGSCSVQPNLYSSKPENPITASTWLYLLFNLAHLTTCLDPARPLIPAGLASTSIER